MKPRRGLDENDVWKASLPSYVQRLTGGSIVPFAWQVHLMRHLQGVAVRGGGSAIVEAPPRHGKTRVIGEWLPTWLLDCYPEKTIILTACTAQLARRYSRAVRNNLVRSGIATTQISEDSHAATEWHTSKGGGCLSAGIGGTIIGSGGDIIVCTDPYRNLQDAMSPGANESLHDWWDGTLWGRRESERVPVIVDQARWDEDDLAGWLAREKPGAFTRLRLPALSEGDDDILGRPKGDPLCPEKFDAAALARIRDPETGIGTEMFECQYQQNPAGRVGRAIFARDNFPLWSELPDGMMVQSWDATFKDGGTSWVVGQAWVIPPAEWKPPTYSGNAAILGVLADQVREKMDYPRLRAEIRAFRDKWTATRGRPPEMVLIEDKANGPAIVADLRAEFGITAFSPNEYGSKIARATVVAPDVEARRLVVPDPRSHPWMEGWLQRVCAFPRAGVPDDEVDAMTQFRLKFAQRPSRWVT